jgi:rSAM-associated Gly-rich repeat protein
LICFGTITIEPQFGILNFEPRTGTNTDYGWQIRPNPVPSILLPSAFPGHRPERNKGKTSGRSGANYEHLGIRSEIDSPLKPRKKQLLIMKKSSSILAAALQLLACAGLFPETSAAKVDDSSTANATISERLARVRTALINQSQSDAKDAGIQLTGWGNWHNGWRNWGNGWRKWGNGWRNWGNGWRKWHNWGNF